MTQLNSKLDKIIKTPATTNKIYLFFISQFYSAYR